MEYWLLVALAVIILPLYWQRKSAQQKEGYQSGAPSQHERPSVSANADHYVRPPYLAVSIVCGESACQEARAVGNIRYLVDDAPILPVAGCDTAKCTCKYLHHRDRRRSNLGRRRSRSVTAEESLLMGTGERRQFPQEGRRATDR